MKVKELIEYLRQCDGEAEVILQKDAEGNGYSPLAGADDEAVYVEENSWEGRAVSLEDLDEEELEDNSYVPCVVLFPVN